MCQRLFKIRFRGEREGNCFAGKGWEAWRQLGLFTAAPSLHSRYTIITKEELVIITTRVIMEFSLQTSVLIHARNKRTVKLNEFF